MIRLLCLLVIASFSFAVGACDSCRCNIGDPARGGAVGLTAGIGGTSGYLLKDVLHTKPDTDSQSPQTEIAPSVVPDLTQPQTASSSDIKYRWSADTSFEYRRFIKPNVLHAAAIVAAGHDQHAYSHDYFITEHIGYVITPDLAIGAGAGYRNLEKLSVDNPDTLGHHDHSGGMTDPELDVKYRFMHQTECFPLDMAVYASVKTPFGRIRNKQRSGDLFEAEDQPGTGSWDETIGIAMSRGMGKWGASMGGSFTFKGVGSQHFKDGNVGRFSVSASRLISPDACSWKLYASMGLQGVVEQKAEDHGVNDGDHGGQFVYALPGIAANPNERTVVSLTVPVPVYQNNNGTHQKQSYAIQLGAGVRF